MLVLKGKQEEKQKIKEKQEKLNFLFHQKIRLMHINP